MEFQIFIKKNHENGCFGVAYETKTSVFKINIFQNYLSKLSFYFGPIFANSSPIFLIFTSEKYGIFIPVILTCPTSSGSSLCC